MRALGRQEFTRYAQQQIEMADQLLARHGPGPGGWCSCGKELPCTVVAHATTTRDHMRAKLALLDATAVLPILTPAAPAVALPWWRRLLLGGWQ